VIPFDGKPVDMAAETVQNDLPVVAANVARAKKDAQYRAVSAEFDRRKAREASLLADLLKAEATQASADAELDMKTIVGGSKHSWNCLTVTEN
jgi:hypothetical protein